MDELATQHSAVASAAPGWRMDQAVQALRAEQLQGTHLHWLAVARLLQAAQPDREPLGHGIQPQHDALKLQHSHHFGFAPREVSGVAADSAGRASLTQDAVGLLGPNGPMPYAWTQYLFELSRPDLADTSVRAEGGVDTPTPKFTSRLAQERANSFLAFINLLQRRHLALFVRAWMDTRAECAFDPAADRYAHPLTQQLSALAGLNTAQDSVPDDFKRAYASAMARRVKSPLPLAAMLGRHLDLPVRIEEFAARWIQLEPQDRSRLGRAHAGLGDSAMLGERCWDARQSFRVLLGPMSFERYREFLPGAAGWRRARDLVATALGAQWHWELVPLLDPAQVPQATLGARPGQDDQPAALGHACWLGKPGGQRPAAELRLPMQASLRHA